MLNFDSPTVLQALQAKDWTAARRCTIPAAVQAAAAGQPQLAQHPALAVLHHLAGLHIGQCGAGLECATSDIEFDWNEDSFTGQDPDEALMAWEQRLNCRLIPIADIHHAHAELLLASDGRCFCWGFGDLSFEADTLQQALEHLLLGIRSRPLLAPGQTVAELYGIRFQAGDPRIYLY